MDLSIIADWFTILFFLWYGLKILIPALNKKYYQILGAVIALGAALFTALST
jgi:Kef-type K+ transport system membrane component KefB